MSALPLAVFLDRNSHAALQVWRDADCVVFIALTEATDSLRYDKHTLPPHTFDQNYPRLCVDADPIHSARLMLRPIVPIEPTPEARRILLEVLGVQEMFTVVDDTHHRILVRHATYIGASLLAWLLFPNVVTDVIGDGEGAKAWARFTHAELDNLRDSLGMPRQCAPVYTTTTIYATLQGAAQWVHHASTERLQALAKLVYANRFDGPLALAWENSAWQLLFPGEWLVPTAAPVAGSPRFYKGDLSLLRVEPVLR